MDKCILWMWIFCFLQGIFTADLIFPGNSVMRRCLWVASGVGWVMSIILWVRYFIGSIRAHRRVMNGTDVIVEEIDKLVLKYTSLATPHMPPQLASSSISSVAHQQNVGGSTANG